MNRFLFVLVITGVITSVVFAGGFQLNEHGARAMGQGGAFAARAYDGSAMYFNPGGLAFQKGMAVYLGTTIIMPTSSYTSMTGTKTDMVSQTFTPISGYFTYEVMDKLTVGVGVNNPFGLGTEWPSNWAGAKLSEKVDLKCFFFSPTAAYQITPELGVGVGFNIVTGTVEITKQLVPIPTVPAIKSKTELELSKTAFGFSVGALYKITPELSAGASYRHSVKLEAEGTAKFTPNPLPTGLPAPYPSSIPLPAGDIAASITLPATGFVGLAYKPMENLEIEVDYQFTGWSSYDKLIVDFKGTGGKPDTTIKNWDDVYTIRVGAEYTMDQFQFRVGYLMDKNPVSDKYIEPMLPDADRNGINLGVGYKVTENINVDLAYMLLLFADRTTTTTDPKINFNGTYKNSANLFALSVGYKF